MSIPMRRVTIVVNDLEESLHFYKDILGMKVYFDQELEGDMNPKLLGLDYKESRSRIVCLEGDVPDGLVIGTVGLLYYFDPPLRPRKEIMEKIATPDILFVFITEDIHALHQTLKQENIRIITDPWETHIPGRGKIITMSCVDPNGIVIEFSQH